MTSTIIVVCVFLGMLLVSFLLWGLLLRLGLCWAKVADVTARRIVLATAIVITLQIAINAVSFYLSVSAIAQSTAFHLLELAVGVIVPSAVISVLFKARFLRSIQAWHPTLLATVVLLLFIHFVSPPFLYEAFAIPTNAMSPTLVGQHWKGTCPQCGRSNYCSPQDNRYFSTESAIMICDNFHVTDTPITDSTVHMGDRILVAKFLAPRRWDLMVFRYPGDPNATYVKRLIGLPGEEVRIQDGAIWIDGQRQTPPDSLDGIEYTTELPNWHAAIT